MRLDLKFSNPRIVDRLRLQRDAESAIDHFVFPTLEPQARETLVHPSRTSV